MRKNPELNVNLQNICLRFSDKSRGTLRVLKGNPYQIQLETTDTIFPKENPRIHRGNNGLNSKGGVFKEPIPIHLYPQLP